MREDMAKVLIERPRYGYYLPNYDVLRDRRRGRTPELEVLERLPLRAGMKPRGQAWVKELSDNLRPLEGYLRSQVGRPWAKVYSELRARLNPRSAVQFHVVEHLFQMVERDVRIEGRAALMNPTDHPVSPGWFFVHPKTGLLSTPRGPVRARRPGRAFSGPPVPRVERGKGGCLLFVGGQWYEVRLAAIPADPEAQRALWDVVFRQWVVSVCDSERQRHYGNEKLYAVSKRQIGRRELVAAGLRR